MKFYIIITAILGILALAIGWYILAPIVCDEKAIQRTEEIEGGDRIDYEYFYRRCLRNWGINASMTDKLLG